MRSDRRTENAHGDRSSLLAPRCSHAFAAGTRSRGLSYFSGGRVRLGPVDENGVLAYVKGSRRSPYQVVLDWGEVEWGDELTVSCDCPEFEGGSLCKHIWATLLTLDDTGEGHWVPGSGRLEMVADYGFDDDVDEDEEDGDEPDDALDEEEPDDFDPFAEEETVATQEDDDLAVALRRHPLSPASAPRRLPEDRPAPIRAPRPSTWAERSARRADVLQPKPEWQRQLEVVGFALEKNDAGAVEPLRRREIWFQINRAVSAARGRLVIDIYQRQERKVGGLGRIKPLALDDEVVSELTDPRERDLARLVMTMPNEHGHWASGYSAGSSSRPRPPVGRFSVPGPLYETVVPRLAATDRLSWWEGDESRPEGSEPLIWDDGPAWRLALRLERTDDRGGRLTGTLIRPAPSPTGARTESGAPSSAEAEAGAGDDGAEDGFRVEPLGGPVLLLAAGLALFDDHLARLDAHDVFPWIVLLRREGWIDIPEEDLPAALEEIFRLPSLPAVELPDELPIDAERPPTHPRLSLRPPTRRRAETPGGSRALRAELAFGYDGVWVAADDPRSAVVDRAAGRLLLRDREAEAEAVELLEALGAGPDRAAGAAVAGKGRFVVPEGGLADTVQVLLEAGWRVLAEGQSVRKAGTVQGSLVGGGGSGMDWFELRGAIAFGDQEVPLPRLLEAARRGQTFVVLGDGSRGIVPPDWTERLRRLADLAPQGEDGGDGEGDDEADTVRFLPSQALLLDTLLADTPEIDLDGRFADLRARLTNGAGDQPLDAPEGFQGTLRPYQGRGLGWLDHLGGLGLGGCLADDMGLGKTIQVLALLDRRRQAAGPTGRTSLVVAPRSLVYNWIDEASRFTPNLATLDYTGTGREELRERFADHDLVITTYGTLRRDVTELTETTFDYVILDEAQAIKNPESQTAKAARLLRADHRLVLTGTPVENHLRELGSLFEFLNPGMLGRASAFAELVGAGSAGALEEEDLSRLSRALGPFILRRTKAQVLPDLPAKTEQTLFVTLGREQRALYEELKAHYRAQLHQRIDELGLDRSRMQVLEALLRLRQAACHPELLVPEDGDGEGRGANAALAAIGGKSGLGGGSENGGDNGVESAGSAKLDTLFEQLDEVLDEGHKALVFSQFTRLLGLVRRRLDANGTVYEYLDGKTRDRAGRVERFQTDPDCRLFLISLKAGGTGLNLTAADYVFLLDPWWNPAVEAQAVDRAHRIGQERPVIAYRLIARDTVEEKILELQKSKRELADAVLSAGGSALGTLTADDLELLLG